MGKTGYVYFIVNKNNNVLYIGVTNNLVRRIAEHKAKINKGFTYKYNCDKLVYYEVFPSITDAIAREKQLKNWKRDWKNKLVNDFNPEWRDLSGDIGITNTVIEEIKAIYTYRNTPTGHSSTPSRSGTPGRSGESQSLLPGIAGQARNDDPADHSGAVGRSGAPSRSGESQSLSPGIAGQARNDDPADHSGAVGRSGAPSRSGESQSLSPGIAGQARNEDPADRFIATSRPGTADHPSAVGRSGTPSRSGESQSLLSGTYQ